MSGPTLIREISGSQTLIKDYSAAPVLSREINGAMVLVRQTGGQAYPVDSDPSALAVDVSAGAADAGKTVKLDAGGSLHRTLRSAAGRETQIRYILSESGDFLPSDPTFAGTMFDSRFQIYGTSQTDTGMQCAIFGNHSKGSRFVFGKSRGALDAYSPCVASDRIVSFDFQAVGTGSQFGHAGQIVVFIDGTPSMAGEIPSGYVFYTGTGTADGNKVAAFMNRRQQVLFPGSGTAPGSIPAADTDLGAVVTLPAGSTTQAPLRFQLSGAALLTTPLSGCLEATTTDLYWSNSSAVRRKFLFEDTRTRVINPAIIGSALTASEVFAVITPPSGETWTFGANFAGASGLPMDGATNPASSFAIDVKKNGTTVGTITISTGGVVSFATSGGSAVSLIGGTDTLKFIGPGTVGTALGFAFAIPASY